MPTSAPGSKPRLHAASTAGPAGPVHRLRRAAARGFTLIEVLVVVAIVALGAALVTLSMREPADTQLEMEAVRLGALLEQARTEARAGGYAVQWVPAAGDAASPEGFKFLGLPTRQALPTRWLNAEVRAEVVGARQVRLGPEAILPAQRIVLRLGDRRLELATDGLSAFAIANTTATP
ncbi:MAG: prepilin-type N-terminal cleavage/methylation domain-containing protein [Rubrivivax sp.]